MKGKARRLQDERLLKDAEALNPQQQEAIEALTDDQVEHLIDLYKHFGEKYKHVRFPPDLGPGPTAQII